MKWPNIKTKRNGVPEVLNPVTIMVLESLFFFVYTLYLINFTFKNFFGSQIGLAGDSYFFRFSGLFVKENHFSPFINQLNWPSGFNILLSDSPVTSYILAVFNLFLHSQLAYNVLVLLLLYSNFLFAKKLFTILGIPRLKSITLALLVGSFPGIVNRADGHLPYVSIAPILLLLIFLVRNSSINSSINSRESQRSPRYAFQLAALLSLNFYWSAYFLVIAVVITLVAYIKNDQKVFSVRDRITCFVFFFALTGPLWFFKLRLALSEFLSAENTGIMKSHYSTLGEMNSLEITSILLPQKNLKFNWLQSILGTAQDSTWILEKNLYLGLPIVFLAGIAIAQSIFKPHSLNRRYSLMVGIVLFLSLGSTPTLFGHEVPLPNVWFEFFSLPVISNFRAPGRFFQLGIVVVFITIGLFWKSVSGRLKNTIIFLVMIFTLLTYQIVLPYTSDSDLFADQNNLKLSSQIRDRTVLVVPTNCPGDMSLLGAVTGGSSELISCIGPASSIAWYSGFRKEKQSELLAQLRCLPYQFGYGLAPKRETPFPPEMSLPKDWVFKLEQMYKDLVIVIDHKHLAAPTCKSTKESIDSEEFNKHGEVLFQNNRWLVVDLYR
jgi:hypothetical protein